MVIISHNSNTKIIIEHYGKHCGNIKIYDDESNKIASRLSFCDCHISTLFTYEQYRNKGYGKLALSTAIEFLDKCKYISLLCYPTDNYTKHDKLKKFYKGFGFESHYYSHFHKFLVTMNIIDEPNSMIRYRDKN